MIEELTKFFKGAKRVVIVGVGSELRGDDAAGLEVVRRLKRILTSRRVMLVEGGAAPENFTTKIKRFNPTHIVFIDAADIGGEPGSMTLIAPERIVGSAFTHRLPLSFLADYLKTQINARILVIGIQPHHVDIGSEISGKVKKAIDVLADALVKILSKKECDCNG